MTEDHFIDELTRLARFVEDTETLDYGLTTLARLVGHTMGCRHCSIMLIKQDPETGHLRMRVEAHHGELPEEAYHSPVALDQGLAGHVARTGQPLLINDLHNSIFAPFARRAASPSDDVISVPVELGNQVIGLINIDTPDDDRRLEPCDLRMASVLALVVGKSIQIQRLQGLLRSHFMRHALAHDPIHAADRSMSQITGDPERVAKIIANALFGEMKGAGFGEDHMLAVSTEILSRVIDARQSRTLQGSVDRPRAGTPRT